MLGHVGKLPAGEHWLLDGFPRTAVQAQSLDEAFDVNLVINLDVPEAEILSRLSNRRVHVGSGRTYHLVWNPPKNEGVDDETGPYTRHSTAATVNNHWHTHHKTTRAKTTHSI